LFYLSNVGRLLDNYGITDEQAERIGWTKLQIVARHAATSRRRVSAARCHGPGGVRVDPADFLKEAA